MQTKENRGALALVVLGGLCALALVVLVLVDTPPAPEPPKARLVQGKLQPVARPLQQDALEHIRPLERDGGQDPNLATGKRRPLPLANLARLKEAAGAYQALAPREPPNPGHVDLPPDTTPITLPKPPPPPAKGMDPSAVQAAVQAALPDVKRCYESGLKMKEDSAGQVKVSFTLVAADGGGFMRDAEIVDSALNNPVTEACVLNALAAARFPVPDGDGQVKVTYPFKFSREDPATP